MKLKPTLQLYPNRIIIIIIISILVTVYWFGFVIPDLHSLPTNYERDIEYVGQDRIVLHFGEELGDLSEFRQFSTEDVVGIENGVLEINAEIISKYVSTNEIVFHAFDTYFVDSTTKKHTESGLYYAFPNNVQKKTYGFLHPSIHHPTTMVFKEVEKIGSLDAYLFECNPATNDNSEAFTQFQDRTIFVDYNCKIWVEPQTGNVLKIQINWDNYFVKDEKRIFPVQLGGTVTSDYANTVLSQFTKQEQKLLTFYELVVPLIIFFSTIFAIITEFLYTKYISEKKYRTSDKLEVLGEMSARVAHDLRNPLHVIRATNEILKMINPKFDESSLKQFQIQDRAITRMVHQLEGVMDFVREKPLTLVHSSLFTLLDTAIDTLVIPKSVKITYPKNDLMINCDPNQMQNVFSNIILNGIQAIHEKGQIDITTPHRNDDSITIIFTDSGPPIPKDVIPKVFEPLFTTKQTGTGLGLASCKTIIESHGGSIRVDTNPTSFKIILPKPTKNN